MLTLPTKHLLLATELYDIKIYNFSYISKVRHFGAVFLNKKLIRKYF